VWIIGKLVALALSKEDKLVVLDSGLCMLLSFDVIIISLASAELIGAEIVSSIKVENSRKKRWLQGNCNLAIDKT
jgi:hypothetical protein